ncbi:MAG: ATP-binding protein [Bacillota bacterium]
MGRRPSSARLGRSIRARLLSSYLLLMLLILSVLGTSALVGLEWYYRSAITDLLSLRAAGDQQFLRQILQGVDLAVAGQDLARELADGLPARVQLYQPDGRLVGDSSLPAAPGPGAPGGASLRDVAAALQGGAHREWVERSPEGRVLHLSLPLYEADGSPAGALRYSTSLAAVDGLVRRALSLTVALGLAVLLVTALVGILFTNSLIRPLRELTRVAEAIGAGNLGLRARVHLPDEVGRLAQTLNRMAESLGELDRMRGDFLRAVSHDLKTPLAAIKAWAITLQDEAVSPEELKQGLATVERSTDHLARLVEDLLLAARLQAGAQIALHPRPTDPVDAAMAACQSMASRAREAGVRLEPPDQEDLPQVLVDPDRLAQMLGNLLANAIKFTPAGGSVRLSLTAAPEAVAVTVADTGVGIPPEELPRLTEPFFRGRAAQGVPGTGLGLAIVSELIRRSGGRMEIESTPGQGTRVTLHLPRCGREGA